MTREALGKGDFISLFHLVVDATAPLRTWTWVPEADFLRTVQEIGGYLLSGSGNVNKAEGFSIYALSLFLDRIPVGLSSS